MINRLLRALCILVAIGALIIGGATTLLAREAGRSVNPDDTEVREFVVEDGWGISDIATNLQEEGLITQPLLFRWLAGQQEVESMQAGTYKLRPNLTMSEIIAILSQRRTGVGGEEIELRIIEGERLEQIAKKMAEARLVETPDAFLNVARNAEPFKANHQRLQSIPPGQGLEGYLFPDTYRFFASDPITDVVNKILDHFDEKYADFENEVTAQTGQGQPPTVHEIVTMASIVQREAANQQEMAHISYVFWNRLRPESASQVVNRLQADPTVQYAIGTIDDPWPNLNERLTREQIDTLDSPYNTYKNQGLPPGPISNPGLDALRAAARPGAQRPDGTDGAGDLYFVAKCGGGGHVFARTNDEFQVLVRENTTNCPQP